MKKKITLVATSVLLVAAMVIGGTLAYFTDTKSQTNTFTAGDVKINLTESVVTKDNKGNLVATNNRTDKDQEYKLYPGMTVTKDPKIDVLDGSETSYIAAKVTITGNLYGLIGVEPYGTIDVTELASGGLMGEKGATSTPIAAVGDLMGFENGECKIYQDYANYEKGEWVLYVFVKAPKAENTNVVLFNTLTIDKNYTNDQMALLDDMQIKVDAYAVQEYGFGSCEAAMAAAFPSDFGAFAPPAP